MATYPLPSFHFQVEWGGDRIGFTEASGLKVAKDVIEYREGTDPGYTKMKMPGMNNWGNITFKRGIIPADNNFFEWLNETKMHVPERRDLTVSLLNEEHAPVMTWKIKSCWPVSVDAPTLNSTANEAAIESLELAHEGITIENG